MGRFITIAVWALIIGMMIFMVTNGCSPSRTESINFDEFAEEYLNDNIKAVYEVLEGGTFYGIYRTSEADATNLPDKADFVLYISNDSFHENMKTLVSIKDGKDKDTVLPSDYNYVMISALPEGTPIYLVLLPYLIEFLLIGFIVFFFIRQQGGGQQMMNFSKANARTLDSNSATVTFNDVAGLVEEKEELQEVVEFMRAPKRFSEMGARIPKGVLLVGPPGTGKTLMAKAVAGEAKVPFYSISGSDFVEMFVGVGASRVRDLFNTAKRSAPAVVFIDEIDAVGRQRGAGLGGGHDEREQTLNQLLVEMDGFAPNEGIIVIAATNRADILDPALLRPGRFDRRITVGYPDVKGREDILKVHARNKKFAPDIDLKTLARRTPYFTGADLENVLNEAAILATRANRKWIEQQDLEEAVTRVQMGPEKKSRVVTPEDNKITAYHESGHAILAIELEHCDNLHEVSIISRGWAAGYTMTLPKEDLHHTLKSHLLDQICMTMGGRVAEKVAFTDVSTGAIQDLKQASEIARKMVEEYGMSDAVGPVFVGGDTEVFIAKDWGHSKNYSEALAAKIDVEMRRILEEQFERAESIIASHKDRLIAVSEMLLKYERVTGEQFEAVYRGADADAVMQGKAVSEPSAPAAAPAINESEEASAGAEPME
ncbi:MAG: ATP-dependent zinc metalloprotease FtsH [Clostridia bacterium]|nr:ATP-dependent zinc metalloprotease FtsH [Clostridia bacterium]